MEILRCLVQNRLMGFSVTPQTRTALPAVISPGPASGRVARLATAGVD